MWRLVTLQWDGRLRGAHGSVNAVQEYCNGGSLRQAVAKGLFEPSRERHWRTIMSLLIDVAQGMAYIHSKRICHGDLNPANVLLKVPPLRARVYVFMCVRV
jgi:serine/threonine protein kinase